MRRTIRAFCLKGKPNEDVSCPVWLTSFAAYSMGHGEIQLAAGSRLRLMASARQGGQQAEDRRQREEFRISDCGFRIANLKKPETDNTRHTGRSEAEIRYPADYCFFWIPDTRLR
ncbi:MAG: hypothetical protein JSV47_12480 [Deltaproteobacteria bacterium]|nr:MAG: hypothetical protein JSV47_12480 [Deltaproteobacteria bacterium]